MNVREVGKSTLSKLGNRVSSRSDLLYASHRELLDIAPPSVISTNPDQRHRLRKSPTGVANVSDIDAGPVTVHVVPNTSTNGRLDSQPERPNTAYEGACSYLERMRYASR